MNYCTIHDQLYSDYCVYCGPPAMPEDEPDWTTPSAQEAGTPEKCGICGQAMPERPVN